MATYKTIAFVLDRKDFREQDKLVTFYTKDYGKIVALARGAKKINSKMASYVEPFYLVDIMFAQAKTFQHLAGIELVEKFGGIIKDLQKIKVASSAVNLLDDLIKTEEPDEKVFNLLHEFFKVLDRLQDDQQVLFLKEIFSFKLLCILGYKPELHACLKCGKKIEPKGNIFDFLKGGLVCGQCKKGGEYEVAVTEEVIKVLRVMIHDDMERCLKLRVETRHAASLQRVVSGLIEMQRG